ncbi:LytR/AlgR family response regulator transcription factor [Spirosoma flavum]|uniref:LytR/AlgR family response regulator transcription factor n=1 Tax=Spirosoma flavum TaxID=2048557 RepID=A0ABW6AE80_9BACT
MRPILHPIPPRLSLPTDSINMYIRHSGQLAIPIADLMFLQATGNYSWLHWKEGQRMLMPRTLKYYIPQLPKEWFVQLHRNCIVNLHYIERMERINPDKGGLVYLQSGAILLVSRRRWFAAKQLFSQRIFSS